MQQDELDTLLAQADKENSVEKQKILSLIDVALKDKNL